MEKRPVSTPAEMLMGSGARERLDQRLSDFRSETNDSPAA